MFGIPVLINVTNKGRSKENKKEMKKNGKMKIVRLFMAITFLLMVAIMSVACGSARTLEDYHEENNLQEALDQQVAGNPCVEAWVEDNELHFKWDVAKDPSVTEEYALSDSMAEDIRAILEKEEAAQAETCSLLEEQAEVEGVNICVDYYYDDQYLCGAVYSKDGIASSTWSE